MAGGHCDGPKRVCQPKRPVRGELSFLSENEKFSSPAGGKYKACERLCVGSDISVHKYHEGVGSDGWTCRCGVRGGFHFYYF